jgi:hypothetical protein
MSWMTELAELQSTTNEMLASTWWETEYCLDVCQTTSSAHIEIYSAHKKHCDAQYLKMYQSVQ